MKEPTGLESLMPRDELSEEVHHLAGPITSEQRTAPVFQPERDKLGRLLPGRSGPVLPAKKESRKSTSMVGPIRRLLELDIAEFGRFKPKTMGEKLAWKLVDQARSVEPASSQFLKLITEILNRADGKPTVSFEDVLKDEQTQIVLHHVRRSIPDPGDDA